MSNLKDFKHIANDILGDIKADDRLKEITMKKCSEDSEQHSHIRQKHLRKYLVTAACIVFVFTSAYFSGFFTSRSNINNDSFQTNTESSILASGIQQRDSILTAVDEESTVDGEGTVNDNGDLDGEEGDKIDLVGETTSSGIYHPYRPSTIYWKDVPYGISKMCGYSKIGKKIGTGYQEHSLKRDVYSVKGKSPDSYIAIKYLYRHNKPDIYIIYKLVPTTEPN